MSKINLKKEYIKKHVGQKMQDLLSSIERRHIVSKLKRFAGLNIDSSLQEMYFGTRGTSLLTLIVLAHISNCKVDDFLPSMQQLNDLEEEKE